jgi:hypothetical protein
MQLFQSFQIRGLKTFFMQQKRAKVSIPFLNYFSSLFPSSLFSLPLLPELTGQQGLPDYEEVCGQIIEKVRFLLTFKPAVMEASNVRGSKVFSFTCWVAGNVRVVGSEWSVGINLLSFPQNLWDSREEDSIILATTDASSFVLRFIKSEVTPETIKKLVEVQDKKCEERAHALEVVSRYAKVFFWTPSTVSVHPALHPPSPSFLPSRLFSPLTLPAS